MVKKIAILGSTGSIGQTLLNIIKRDKKNFKIILLTAKKNSKKILEQAKQYNVKNIIITDLRSYINAKSKIKNTKINLYNNFDKFKKIFPKKIDYTMSSIVGLDGLYPTIKIIKFTKQIAIANKESIICAWNLIERELLKHKTEFIPVDSEHFSIWYALKNKPTNKIEKIYLTASGGSLLKVPKKKYGKIKLSKILQHPNWKMGRKITIDSSTLMNKVFEIIEAKKIFKLNYNQLEILIHPKSYVHAIIKFTDGLIKLIAHETTMEIPIFNSIYHADKKKLKTKNIDLKKLNKLNFSYVNSNKFPLVKTLKKLPYKDSLFETVLVSTNDELVNLFLNKKINYDDIHLKLTKIININEFKKLKKILPRNISHVIKTSEHVHNKIKLLYSK
tara:strand:- start:1211 stop:2377 length:1167 start_codon:yes stop_codon:yes gene_type:complete